MRNGPMRGGPRNRGIANAALFFISCLGAIFLTIPFSSPVLGSSGTEAASFLDIPVGGAPAAMGGAYSASATDAYAPVWNPAGLGFLDSTQAAAQHLSYLESIHYEHLSLVHPIAAVKGGLGFSAQYLGTGDIGGTDLSGTPTGDFSSHFAAYGLSYGQMLGDRFSIGAAAKYIDARISDVSGGAYAADIGSLYRVSSKLALAAVLTNLGTQLTFLSDHEDLPLAGHLAAAYQPTSQWNLTAEGVYGRTGLASGHWGVEWRPLNLVAIRAGYRTDTTKSLGAEAGVTAGLGLKAWGQEFSYTWAPYGDLGSVQYFSLLLKFNEGENRKRNLIYYRPVVPKTVGRIREGSEDTQEPTADQLMKLLWDEDKRPMAQAQ